MELMAQVRAMVALVAVRCTGDAMAPDGIARSLRITRPVAIRTCRPASGAIPCPGSGTPGTGVLRFLFGAIL